MSDSYESFNSWITEDFNKRHKGFVPKNIKKWYDNIESSHGEIRKLLGGTKYENTIKLKSQQNPANRNEAMPIIASLVGLIPGYLRDYQLTSESLLLPTIPRGSHNAQKISKHIKTYAQERYDLGSDASKEIDRLLSELGTLWSKARTNESELTVTISTTPKGFALLGHYGPDSDSCFRQGSDKTDHKYIFGQSKNTFVITISKFYEEKKKHVNVARCMGFANDDMTVFSLANYYFLPKFQEGDAIEAIKQTFEKLVGKPLNFVENVVSYSVVYHNPYGNWALSTNENIDRQVLKANVLGIKLFICEHCFSEEKSSNGWVFIDGKECCNSCISMANTCALSKEFTFRDLVELIDKDGDTILVHPDLSVYPKCSICNHNAMSTTKTKNNLSVCERCLDPNFHFCDKCEQYVANDDICQFSEEDICTLCSDEGYAVSDDCIDYCVKMSKNGERDA